MLQGILLFADRLPPLTGGMEMHAKYFIEYFFGHPRFPLLAIISKDSEKRDILLWKGTTEIINFEILSQRFNPELIFFNSGCWIEGMERLKEMFHQTKFIYRTGGNEILKAPLVQKKIPNHLSRQNYWKDTINRNVDLMITNSTYTESRLHKLGIITPFIRCVGGVNVDALKYSKRYFQDCKTIFCAARFVPYKNHLLLLDVFHQLRSRGFDVALRFAGDGPCFGNAKKYASDLGLDSAVNFLGVLDNEKVCQEIAQADVYMQLSADILTEVPGGSYIHSECMGRSILEAITAGTYVIAGRSGALEEIVSSDRGSLVDLDPPLAIANKIEDVFRSLPARPSFCKDYSWKTLFKRYEEIFSI